jgi:uncharacterized protein (TIGR02246 family)
VLEFFHRLLSHAYASALDLVARLAHDDGLFGSVERRGYLKRLVVAPLGDFTLSDRPTVGVKNVEASDVVAAFVAGLQAGYDQRDAEVLNRQFAADIIWGSPYGALISGYDQLHPIHVRFQARPRQGPSFRCEVRHVLPIGEEAIVAHIARLALDPNGMPLAVSFDPDRAFSEMALYVLVRRHGQWWVAAGQHTPMRPGGAVSAVS